LNARLPDDREIVPVLLDKVLPIHQVIPVDFYLPGCPPPADRIRSVVQSLLEGKVPVLEAEERSFG
jgi:NAD-reducing hydrogenase small subunit